MIRYKSKVILITVLTSLFLNVGSGVSAVGSLLKTDDLLKKTSETTNTNTKLLENDLDELIDKINVSPDPDPGRLDFEDEINNPNDLKTPTTVVVEPSDQITNLSTYKAQAQTNNTYAAVNSWQSLKDAYTNNSTTYIEVTADISAEANVAIRDLGWRTTGVIIDGGGFTVNMDRAAFNLGTNLTVRGSIFTITNINLIHWQSGTNSGDSGTGTADAVIDTQSGSNGYGYWNFNIDNVTLTGKDGENGGADSNPRRLLDSEDSSVILSGKIVAAAKQELMQIGQVAIANNAHVELNRTVGTTGFSMFYFMAVRGDNTLDTGYDHTFTVGDGATVIGNELSTYNANSYPLVYYGYNSITVGDNVNWSQDGFQMLLDLSRYVGTTLTGRFVTFGQNLNMVALRTVGYNSLTVAYNGTVTFNAGTVLDLQQWNNATVVRADSGSSITFISPKSLHLSRNNANGTPASGPLFTVAGSFTMNNSQISTWQGSDSQSVSPSGNKNLKFSQLTVSGNTTTVKSPGGVDQTSDIIGNTTRELATTAIDPGTVKFNYVDYSGKVLSSVNYPINSTDNYIGQYIQIKTKEYAKTKIPENYIWALADQAPQSAVSDAQSGGDPTTSTDNGDEYGQASIGIVPMEGTEYVYNIYLYGDPNTNIQYEYKDMKSGNLLTSEFLNAGKEKAGTDLIPANYGNTIDWTNDYYTYTNVPQGYHYATLDELGENIQPTTTNVGTEPDSTTLFVYPDKQTVIVTIENADGTPLVNQESPISIDGYSGLEMSYEELLSGKITEVGMSPESGTFIYDYTDNRGSTVDKTPQLITVKLDFVQVNMSVKQVYKDQNNQLIYTNLESQTLVDNTDNNYLVTIDDNIPDVMNNLKTMGSSEIKIDYDWYQTINTNTDYSIIVDGEKVTTDKVPNKDFDLLITYTGVTNFEVSNLDYGQIPIVDGDYKVFDNPNKEQKATVINTDLLKEWDLMISTAVNIKKDGVSDEYLGGLLVQKNGVDTVIDSSGVKFSSQTEQSNPLISNIPMDIKLFQNSGNSLGSYEGTVLWTLQDTP